jgi:cytochrome P450
MSLEQTAAPTQAPRMISDLPGPPGLPWLGNTLQVKRNRLHLQLEEWARRYGGAFQLTIVPRRFMVLSEPEAVAGVLRDRPDGFRRSTRLERISAELGFLGLFSANGATWKRQRPMVLAGLDPSHIKAFFPTLIQVTERFAKRWGKAAQSGAAIDLQADLMRYTVDVTAALAFGEDINTIEAEQEVLLQHHLNQVLPQLFKRVFSPFQTWKYLPSAADKALPGHLRAIREAVDGFIAKTARKLQEQPELREHPANLIQAMMAARDREGSGITDADVSGNVLTMLLAGEDTTANTLAWLIWLLRQNPQALQRANEEARSVLEGRPCPRDIGEVARLDFIEACAYEAMRLKPVAPMIVNEVAGHGGGRRRGAGRFTGDVPDATGRRGREPLS